MSDATAFVVIIGLCMGVAVLYHIGRVLDRIETLLQDRLQDHDDSHDDRP